MNVILIVATSPRQTFQTLNTPFPTLCSGYNFSEHPLFPPILSAPPPFQLETREYPSYKYTLLFHKNVVLYEKVILFWPKPLRTLRKFQYWFPKLLRDYKKFLCKFQQQNLPKIFRKCCIRSITDLLIKERVYESRGLFRASSFSLSRKIQEKIHCFLDFFEFFSGTSQQISGSKRRKNNCQ